MESRMKERGGGGGKIMASKPQRSLSGSTPKEKSSSRKTPVIVGKENLRSVSTGKASAGVRWSTSSMPRGNKAPNPPDFSKIISGLHGERQIGKMVGMVGIERKSFDGMNVSEKLRREKVSIERPMNGLKALEARKAGAYAALISVKHGCQKDKLDLNLNLADSNSKRPKLNREKEDEMMDNKPCSVPNLKIVNGKALDNVTVLVSSCRDYLVKNDVDRLEKHKGKDSIASNLKANDVAVDHKGEQVREKASEKIRVFENVTRKTLDEEGEGVNEEGKGVKGISKYPSKIHEKLALLEGKVQKIALDIKRTKDMLDQNNTSDSKLVLSDIQSKISGLEKAVGQVMDGTKDGICSAENVKNDCLLTKLVVDMTSSVEELKHEELEARFIPYNRLLKGWTLISSSEDRGQCSKPNLSIQSGEIEEGSLCPIDENPTAVEFLASLDGEQPDAMKEDRTLRSEIAATRERGMEGSASSAVHSTSRKVVGGIQSDDIALMADEKLEDFDDQENKPVMMLHEDTEESCVDQLSEIGCKASTSGWFVSEGEAVLLAHDDGSCSYYDIANSEEKSVYKPPTGVSNNLWGDCWLIRAPGVDGCSGRYVVAASAGNTLDSGFCSWDFYTKDIRAFHLEDGSPNSFSTSSSRTVLAPLIIRALSRRSASSTMPAAEGRQWWYRPCGPLIVSTASRQKLVSVYDIRDGDLVMKWEANSQVNGMEYSSPLQWRSRGKVVVTEAKGIALWDVNSLNPQALLSVASDGKIYALDVNNTDTEWCGGVRQRVSSSEVEGKDGIFCTQESINVLDFRLPSGVGHRISRSRTSGTNTLSIFSRGDSIFIGSTESRLSLRSCLHSCVQQYSLRNGRLISTYTLPESNSHFHHSSITQVFGSPNLVMGICGMGLFVFDALKEESTQSLSIDCGKTVAPKEKIGPDDLYRPTFDYHGSRVLVISRDRPALWRYLL